MYSSNFSWDLFNEVPIVGIIRNIDSDAIQNLLPVYHSAGLTTVEITMNTPGASSMIEEAGRLYNGRLNVGAGTVKNLDDLESALKAGASFIVTPILDELVIRECVRLGVPVFPGAYTPSEIYKAWSLGASIVKVFPATSLGPQYFKDVLAPLNEIRIMPTGGVSLDSIAGFHKAGACAYGIGSPLFDKSLIGARNWEALENHFSQFTRQIRELNRS